MKNQRNIGLKEAAFRTVLAAVTAAGSMVLSGCGEQLAAIEQNQFTLQEMMQDSQRQAADNTAAIEKGQRKLQGGMEINLHKIAGNISVLEQNQHQLRRQVAVHLESVMGSIADLKKNQAAFRNGIEKHTRDLADNTSTVASAGQELRELQRVVKAVQSDAQKAVAKMVAVEQNQHNLQEAMGSTVRQIASNIESIARGLAGLQEMVANLQNNTEEVTTKVALIETNQVDLRRQMQSQIQQVLESIEAIEREDTSVSPAESAEETIPTEASVAAADDVDTAE